MVDVLVAVPSEETPRIQECQILAGHALCDAIEQAILGGHRAPAESSAAQR
jgi:D-sedoheptulose 7-phosphate isomerase